MENPYFLSYVWTQNPQGHQVAIVQVIDYVEDERCFSTLTFMKTKLRNRLTMHLELVIHMGIKSFFHFLKPFLLVQQFKIGRTSKFNKVQKVEVWGQSTSNLLVWVFFCTQYKCQLRISFCILSFILRWARPFLVGVQFPHITISFKIDLKQQSLAKK